jgi:hypothetical protein
VVTELCKILIAAASFAVMPRNELRRIWRGWSWADSLTSVAPPAVLYAIQNILIQASYKHKINSVMFNLVSSFCIINFVFCISTYCISLLHVLCLVLAEPNKNFVCCALDIPHHG